MTMVSQEHRSQRVHLAGVRVEDGYIIVSIYPREPINVGVYLQ
jgi:hypothetical protein